MSRIMAIDYGTKRTGIAVTDSSRLIARGLTTVPTKDLVSYLKDYFAKEEVEILVVGEPKTLDNKKGKMGHITDAIVKDLQRKFPEKKLMRSDERFTSKIAFESLLMTGLKKKDRQNKDLVDEVSATLILQSFLESPAYKNTLH